MKNYKKIRDFTNLLEAFENLTKAYNKARGVIEKDEGGNTPRFFVRCLADTSDVVDECWEDKEFKKKTNKLNAKALANLRQKLRKYLKEFESDITKYRESPDDVDVEEASEEEKESGSDSGSESEDEPEQGTKLKKSQPAESDSDSLDWGSSDESTSSSEDEYADDPSRRFLKKPDADEKKKTEKKERQKDKPRSGRRKAEEEEDGEGWQKISGGQITQEKPKLFSKDDEITHELVLRKINEVVAMRGKKRIHRSDQMSLLKEILDVSQSHHLGPAIEVKVLFSLIAGVLSYNNTVNPSMKPWNWNHLLKYCNRMLDLLTAHPDISVGEKISEESESYEKPPFRVSGCALTLIERMDDEFTKMLQAVDAHSPEYIERLKDEDSVCRIIQRMASYLQLPDKGTPVELCRVYILKIDHMYYKFDPEAMAQKDIRRKLQEAGDGNGEVRNGTESSGKETESSVKETSLDMMEKLCKYVYSNDKSDRIRTQAMLYHIYHHALHDNWFQARDLMLMSHLQHNISKSDIPLQIIYNRALVQLGLCAFRHGNIKDAHTALLDIQILGRAKELLAQGLLPRQQERTPEQERMEKRRLLPFHKHINLELLECVYLVSAMLLEIPDVAANEYSIRKKMISRSFYNQLRKNEEQPLVGLPESMREHVVAASKAMRVGNWKSCAEFIINEKMNSKVWNLFHRPEKVREMLNLKIREESLRAYLFTYSHVYDSISLSVLSEIFNLDHAIVHSIISKMTTNEELMVSKVPLRTSLTCSS